MSVQAQWLVLGFVLLSQIPVLRATIALFVANKKR